MTIQKTYHMIQNRRGRNTAFAACLAFLILITITLDFVYSRSQGTSFYLSESALFSSFWLLFLPLLSMQLKLAEKTKDLPAGLLITALVTVIHLYAYPALVWLLSEIFYYHTFSYWQTFSFGLTEHFIKAVIIYSLPLSLISISGNKLRSEPLTDKDSIAAPERFLASLIVSVDSHTKTIIQVNDILYFSANSPYINIHYPTKKYLYTETLRSLETQLDNRLFVRIHRSYIVNICHVVSYRSRMNGDYDLSLSDDTLLRVSRNYAASFKSRFEEWHRVTLK